MDSLRMSKPTLPLFYKSPRPLLADRDGDLSLLTEANHAFAAGTNSVPLMAMEFAATCKHFPILFTDCGRADGGSAGPAHG
jgi:hypothetical protein